MEIEGHRPGKELNEGKTEKALHEWVYRTQYTDINKLFGCSGQLFCSSLPLRTNAFLDPDFIRGFVLDVARAAADATNSPYQTELLFSVIHQARDFYRNLPPQKRYPGGSLAQKQDDPDDDDVVSIAGLEIGALDDRLED